MPAFRNDIRTALDEVRRGGPETATLQARVVARVNDEIGRTQSNRGWPLAVAAGVLAALAVLGLVVGTHALRPTPAHRQQAPVFPPTSYSGQFVAYDVAARALVVLTLDSHGQASTWLWGGSSWHRAVGTQPVVGQSGQMAYDAARREVVLFSSSGGAGTWVWNGTWREASSGITPGPTAESGFMADDPLLGKVVYYDQNAGGWTWDGRTWERLSGVLDLMPSGLAFDGTRLILFGQDLSGEGSQTWAWNGSAWAEISQAAAPPPGAYAMGTGPGGRGLILYGGGEPPFPPDDTWLWGPDTMTWSLARPAHTPGPRLANIVYAPYEHHVLLYGGYELNDLWTWTGSDWQRVSGGTQPIPTAPGKTMSAGALTAYLASHSAGVSPLLAPSWLPASLDQGWISTESPKGGAAIVDFGYYDADRQMSIRVSVEVPGNSNLGAANRNIGFRGTTALYQFFAGPPVRPLSLWWTEPGQWAGSQLKTPGIPYAITGHGLSEGDFLRAANSLVAVAAQAPAPRFGAAVAYDQSAGLDLMFGGTDGSGASGAMADTWTWDGSAWHQLTPAASPPARAFAGMASDGSGGLVLFGGGAANADQPRNDTWRWDGSTWTQLHPAHAGPMLSTQRVMAYDPAIHRIVLFTGNQTWEWTGTDWVELTIAEPTAPGGSQRQYFGLAFDPASKRLLLFGGDQFGPPFTPLADTWAFDGNAWTRLSASGPAGGIAVMGMVADGVVMLGQDRTWKWTGSAWRRQPAGSGPEWGYFGVMASAGGAKAVLVPGKPDGAESPQPHFWGWTGSSWATLT